MPVPCPGSAAWAELWSWSAGEMMAQGEKNQLGTGGVFEDKLSPCKNKTSSSVLVEPDAHHISSPDAIRACVIAYITKA